MWLRDMEKAHSNYGSRKLDRLKSLVGARGRDSSFSVYQKYRGCSDYSSEYRVEVTYSDLGARRRNQ